MRTLQRVELEDIVKQRRRRTEDNVKHCIVKYRYRYDYRYRYSKYIQEEEEEEIVRYCKAKEEED